MSISDTSISTSSTHSLNSLSVNNITEAISTNTTKASVSSHLVFQAANNVSLASGISLTQSSVEQNKQVTINKTSIVSTTLSTGVTVAPRHIKPSPTIITIAAPTRTSVSLPQTVKTPYGKHQLPVRPLPITLSQIGPKPTMTTSNASLGDPGGGIFTKPVSIQPPLISGQVPTRPKTYTYHLSNQTGATPVSNNHPAINVTTTRVAVVRPISASPANRTLVPLAMATAPENTKHTTKLTNVHHQPTSTISISIPAKSNNLAEVSTAACRVSVAGPQAVRSVYQVGLSTTPSSSALTTIKPPRLLATSQSGIKPNYNVPLLSNSVSTSSGPAFTYTASRHTSIATITTSAVSVAKVIPPQSTQRIHAIHPVVSGISGHARTNDLVASTLPVSANASSVVTSLSNQKTTTTQHNVQAPLIYWPPASIPINSALYTPSSFTAGSDGSIRPALNVAVSNASTLNDAQIRINPSSLFASTTTNSTVPAFTQGQLLHSNNTSVVIKDQPRPTPVHHSSSTSTHLPNSSPKPAILRRPPRVENKQSLPASTTKKLIFDTQTNRPSNKSDQRNHGIVESGASSTSYTLHESVFPVIKPELSNQGGFNKPVATSNGISPASKLLRANLNVYSSSYSPGVNKDLTISATVRHPPNINDIKVKTEPGVPHTHFKIDTATHLPSATFHPSYLNKIQDPLHHQTQGKIAMVQPHVNFVPPPRSPSLHHVLPRLSSPGLLQQNDAKSEIASFPPSSVVLKREHDKISGEEINSALSPRKKPRKQTHVVAEELPDADHVVDDEMSTDDADECEDEVPLASLARDSSSKAPSSSQASSSDCAANASLAKPCNQKPRSEFVDKDGVRYMVAKTRPPITMLNGHRVRPVINHFLHYSDIKVKEKKVTLQDSAFSEKYLKGWKLLQFAAQLEELAALDADILRRIVLIKESTLEHVAALLTNGKPDPGSQSPAQVRPNSTPPTPCSTPGQPKGFTSFVMSLPSASNDTVALLNSPLTPNERKTSRLREEVLKVEDKAQANIQRSRVIQDQLEETKTLMLKVLKQRNLANKVVKVVREAQKPGKATNGSSSRNSKKKKS